jgi:hypothetical protein
MDHENGEKRVAVLIDAENVAGKYISIILNEANILGNVIIRRIYGDWTNPQMSSWKNVILNNSVQPIQQYANVSGKNSSDSALIIDAMDLLYQGRMDCFCIVSSDSDFTRLAARLRESEIYVLGMGERKTPQSFVSACNKFSYIDLLYNAGLEEAKSSDSRSSVKRDTRTREEKAPDTKKETKPASSGSPESSEENGGSKLNAIRRALVQIADENSDDDGWIASSLLGNLLSRKYPDFDVRNFQYKKFVPFVDSLNLFDMRKQALNVSFRLK